MPAHAAYSLISKKENAHDENIYCCDWVQLQFKTSGDSVNTSKDYIVTGGLDCLVKVWTLQNNNLVLLHCLGGHSMAVVSVAICPTASIIVSTSLDSHLILWDLMTGKKITEIPIGESIAWKVVFSPDGKQFATGSDRGEVYLYGVHDGEIARILDTRGTFVLSIDWSRNGGFIATGSSKGMACLIDVQQGKLLHTLEAHTLAIRSIAFSPCSKHFATASEDKYLKIYGVISGDLLCKLEHQTWVVSVCFTTDGTRVATGDADGSVRICRAKDLTLLNKFKEHDDSVWGLRFDKNNKILMSVSKDKSINLYECPLPPK